MKRVVTIITTKRGHTFTSEIEILSEDELERLRGLVTRVFESPHGAISVKQHDSRFYVPVGSIDSVEIRTTDVKEQD